MEKQMKLAAKKLMSLNSFNEETMRKRIDHI